MRCILWPYSLHGNAVRDVGQRNFGICLYRRFNNRLLSPRICFACVVVVLVFFRHCNCRGCVGNAQQSLEYPGGPKRAVTILHHSAGC